MLWQMNVLRDMCDFSRIWFVSILCLLLLLLHLQSVLLCVIAEFWRIGTQTKQEENTHKTIVPIQLYCCCSLVNIEARTSHANNSQCARCICSGIIFFICLSSIKGVRARERESEKEREREKASETAPLPKWKSFIWIHGDCIETSPHPIIEKELQITTRKTKQRTNDREEK